MTRQLDLFNTPHNSRPTSQAAAESIKPIFSQKAQELYEFIVSRGPRGCTDQEAQIALGESGDSHRPRRDRLDKAGLIVRNGETRPTESGRQADVWIAVCFRDEATP